MRSTGKGRQQVPGQIILMQCMHQPRKYPKDDWRKTYIQHHYSLQSTRPQRLTNRHVAATQPIAAFTQSCFLSITAAAATDSGPDAVGALPCRQSVENQCSAQSTCCPHQQHGPGTSLVTSTCQQPGYDNPNPIHTVLRQHFAAFYSWPTAINWQPNPIQADQSSSSHVNLRSNNVKLQQTS